MESRVMYQPSTGWITIHMSAYHAWQGHISDVPYRFLGYIFDMQFSTEWPCGQIGKVNALKMRNSAGSSPATATNKRNNRYGEVT